MSRTSSGGVSVESPGLRIEPVRLSQQSLQDIAQRTHVGRSIPRQSGEFHDLLPSAILPNGNLSVTQGEWEMMEGEGVWWRYLKTDTLLNRVSWYSVSYLIDAASELRHTAEDPSMGIRRWWPLYATYSVQVNSASSPFPISTYSGQLRPSSNQPARDKEHACS